MEFLATLIPTLIKGAVSLFSGLSANKSAQDAQSAAIASNERINAQNIAFAREKMEYEKPVNAADRLRAAGISPSLMGLDNAGMMQVPELNSSADAIMQAGLQQADVLRGLGPQLLDTLERDKVHEEKKIDQELKHREVSVSEGKLAIDMRTADDEHVIKSIETAVKRDSAFMSFYLAGRDEEILPEKMREEYKRFVEHIDPDAPLVKLAREKIQSDISEAELTSLINGEKSKYEKMSPLSVRLSVEEEYNKLMRGVNLRRGNLQNDILEVEKHVATETKDSRVDFLNSDYETAKKDNETKEKLIKKYEDWRSVILNEQVKLNPILNDTRYTANQRALNKIDEMIGILTTGKDMGHLNTNFDDAVQQILPGFRK